MMDLRQDLKTLFQTLALSAPESGGRTLMFMSARAGEGVSSVAASFGLLAEGGARKPVWLVDLDLRRNHLFNSFAVGAFATKFGGVGPPYSAALKTQPFFSIEPESAASAAGLGLFTAHRVGETRLMVTQFDAERVDPGHTVRIRNQPTYWNAARSATDWAIIDAPALDRSNAGLVIAPHMDAIVIVVRADETTPAEIDLLRREIEARGGKVAGMVVNRVKADARFVERLSQ
jgi:Mrp family chromosome partitioning ATPase